MNTEQFQQLLDMVGSAGQGAFWLAVLYLLQGFVVPLIWAAFWAFLAWRAGITIQSLFWSHQFALQVARALGVSSLHDLSYPRGQTAVAEKFEETVREMNRERDKEE